MGVFSIATFRNIPVRVHPERRNTIKIATKSRWRIHNHVSRRNKVIAPRVVVNRDTMRSSRRRRLLNNRLRRSSRWSRCGLSCWRWHWCVCGSDGWCVSRQDRLNNCCRSIRWNHYNGRWCARCRPVMGIGSSSYHPNDTAEEKKGHCKTANADDLVSPG